MSNSGGDGAEAQCSDPLGTLTTRTGTLSSCSGMSAAPSKHDMWAARPRAEEILKGGSHREGCVASPQQFCPACAAHNWHLRDINHADRHSDARTAAVLPRCAGTARLATPAAQGIQNQQVLAVRRSLFIMDMLTFHCQRSTAPEATP